MFNRPSNPDTPMISNEVTVSAVKTVLPVIESTRGKIVRQSKKDIFATLPATMKRADKEAAFARYAEQFSSMEFAAISGAVASGLVLVRATRPTKRGFSVSLETVKENAPRAGKVAKLEAEIAALRAQLNAAAV